MFKKLNRFKFSNRYHEGEGGGEYDHLMSMKTFGLIGFEIFILSLYLEQMTCME